MINKLFKFVLKLVMMMLLIVLLDVILIATLPINLWAHEASKAQYQNWMEETIDNDTKLIDIKMLGAHDAFSSKTSYSSSVDKALVKSKDTTASLASSPVNFLYKGIFIRLMKAQQSNATTLLKQGVRYLDVRLTYNVDKEDWYTTHTFLSDNAKEAFNEVNLFLEANKKEIIIFDIQHVYDERTDDGKANENSYKEVKQLLIDTNLYEKAVDFTNTSLNEMTYGKALEDSSSGKVVLIMKNNLLDGKILDYNTSIRSNWANTIDDDTLINFIEKEVNDIKDDIAEMSKFRVMQAQKTAQISSLNGIYQTIMSYSLLSMARKSNNMVLNNEKFDEYIEVLPIFMVDYSDTNHGNFNDLVMDKIIDSNKK